MRTHTQQPQRYANGEGSNKKKATHATRCGLTMGGSLNPNGWAHEPILYSTERLSATKLLLRKDLWTTNCPIDSSREPRAVHRTAQLAPPAQLHAGQAVSSRLHKPDWIAIRASSTRLLTPSLLPSDTRCHSMVFTLRCSRFAISAVENPCPI